MQVRRPIVIAGGLDQPTGMLLHRVAFACAFAAVAGCAVNPVTGRREIHMVSEAQEIQLGERYYKPSRQSQGGDYVTDPAVGRRQARGRRRSKAPLRVRGAQLR